MQRDPISAGVLFDRQIQGDNRVDLEIISGSTNTIMHVTRFILPAMNQTSPSDLAPSVLEFLCSYFVELDKSGGHASNRLYFRKHIFKPIARTNCLSSSIATRQMGELKRITQTTNPNASR